MTNLEKDIQNKFVKIENELEDIIKKVEKSEDYFEICSAFKGQKQNNGIYKGGKDEEDIRHEWQTFEQFEIGRRLGQYPNSGEVISENMARYAEKWSINVSRRL